MQLCDFSEEETEAQGGEETVPRPWNPFVTQKGLLSGPYLTLLAHWDFSLVSWAARRAVADSPSPAVVSSLQPSSSVFQNSQPR